jgi:hypothetical protein
VVGVAVAPEVEQRRRVLSAEQCVVAATVAERVEQRRRVLSAEQCVVAAAVAERIERRRLGVDETAVGHHHLLPH